VGIDMKRIYISIISLLLGTIVAEPICSANTTDDVAQQAAIDRLKILECVSPDLRSYWKGGTSDSDDEFILVYSVQGFWADIQSRLPTAILQAIKDSSAKALAQSKITIAARDMPALSAKFYAELQIELSNLGKLPDGSCGIQVGQLSKILDERYRFFIRHSSMDSWFKENHINELNVANHEFLALYAMGSDLKGTCLTAWHEDSKFVKICE
jgi:hypothetical protein